MPEYKTKNNRNIEMILMQLTLTVASIVMIVGLFATSSNLQIAHIFDLRFNSFALISAASALVNLSFLIYLSKSKIRGTEAVWFALFISCILFVAIAETFQRLSATPEAALFWSRLLGLVGLETAAAFIFLLNYFNPNVRYVRLTAMLLLSFTILFFFHADGNVIYNNTVEGVRLYPWGYNNAIGPGFIYHMVWLSSIAIAGVFLMTTYLRSAVSETFKKQTKLLLWAFLFPLLGGVSTEVIYPLFNGGESNLVPLHVAFGTLSAGLMLWGINKYRFFTTSPAILSEDILSLMNESVVVTDKDLKIEFVNKEAQKVFDRSGGIVHGTTITALFEQESSQRFVKLAHSLKQYEKSQLDNVVLRTGDMAVYARLSVSRISEDRGFDGYIAVITDITELKESYAALEKEKNSVEEVVQLRTKELRDAQIRLIENDKLKTEFVLLTSHNLRTPLTIVKGDLELLSSPTINNEAKTNFLANAQASVVKLGELVEELLTISTIEGGEGLAMQDSSVDKIIQPLLEDTKRLAAVNENVFSTSIITNDQALRANPSRLRAALRNILDNACKFTKNGTVMLDARIEGSLLKIIVRDTGIGIDEHEIPKLFTKFHRATDTMQYDYEGEGIGLYMSKLIIEEHGGTVRLESIKGEGTTATVSLPLTTSTTQ